MTRRGSRMGRHVPFGTGRPTTGRDTKQIDGFKFWGLWSAAVAAMLVLIFAFDGTPINPPVPPAVPVRASPPSTAETPDDNGGTP